MSSLDSAINPSVENTHSSQVASEAGTNNSPSQNPGEEISKHVEALLQPVSNEVPVGQDPRYGDAFYFLKTEIDKLADNDYPEILVKAKQVLANEGKDLRVAGYYMLAASYVHGVEGLLDGIALYQGLLERFGRYCFPARDQARNTALSWLNNKKLASYVNQHVGQASRNQLEDVIRGISEINTLIADIVGDDHIAWTSITERVVKAFEKAMQKPVALQAPENGEDETSIKKEEFQPGTPDSESLAGPATSTPVTHSIPEFSASVTSESEFLQQIRALMGFLTESGDLMRAAAIARAVQWGNLQTPPNEKGKTRLPAPRKAGIAEIEEQLSAGSFVSAWRLCESMLFEPGCHVLLDLQRYAVQAAKGMRRNDVASLVREETSALLTRLPGLSKCRFDDDTPFAQAETQRWIAGFSQHNNSVPSSKDKTGEQIKALASKARDAAHEKSLAAGLAILDQGGSLDSRDRFELRMEMAVLCMDYQRAALALPVLEELSSEAQQTHLSHWNRDLALTLARHHQDALQLVMSQSSGVKKEVFERKIDELAATMCTADLVGAADILHQ